MESHNPEKIEWVFTDYYYQHLINQMDRISKLMVYYNDYQKAFGELQDIFNTINYSIEKYDHSRYELFIGLIEEVNSAIYDYKMSQYAKNLPRRALAVKQTNSKMRLITKINEFHRELMKIMDEMGMMFRRSKIDNRKDIFKTG